MPRDPVIAGEDCHDRAQNSRRPTVEAASQRQPFRCGQANFWAFDAAEIVANASSRALVQRRQTLYERAKSPKGSPESIDERIAIGHVLRLPEALRSASVNAVPLLRRALCNRS